MAIAEIGRAFLLRVKYEDGFLLLNSELEPVFRVHLG